MKYLSKKPFSSGVNSDAFRTNIERMFGKREIPGRVNGSKRRNDQLSKPSARAPSDDEACPERTLITAENKLNDALSTKKACKLTSKEATVLAFTLERLRNKINELLSNESQI